MTSLSSFIMLFILFYHSVSLILSWNPTYSIFSLTCLSIFAIFSHDAFLKFYHPYLFLPCFLSCSAMHSFYIFYHAVYFVELLSILFQHPFHLVKHASHFTPWSLWLNFFAHYMPTRSLSHWLLLAANFKCMEGSFPSNCGCLLHHQYLLHHIYNWACPVLEWAEDTQR